MREEVLEQATYLDSAPIDVSARQQLEVALALFSDDGKLAERINGQRCLISFDAHPGNFLITPQGKAILVDLEKCRYCHPGLDLVPASLYTSTTWDLASHAVLDVNETADIYRHWWAMQHKVHSRMDVEALVATRQAMWLWSTTWCVRWLTLHTSERDTRGGGEDWSAALSEKRLIAHVEERTRHYLKPATLRRVRDDNHRLVCELSNV